MPTKPGVPCRGSATCSKPGPYCEDHRGMRKAGERERGTAHQRGYTARWRRVRKRYASRNPMCEDCLAAGRAVPLDVVDHVIPLAAGGAAFDPRNLRSLCNPCHGKKTAQDRDRYPDVYNAAEDRHART